MITGHLGRTSEAVKVLIELVETLGISVIEPRWAKRYMNFPTDHPLHMGHDPYLYLKKRM